MSNPISSDIGVAIEHQISIKNTISALKATSTAMPVESKIKVCANAATCVDAKVAAVSKVRKNLVANADGIGSLAERFEEMDKEAGKQNKTMAIYK